MILNCWSETREKTINFPRLDLDQRHSFQVAVRNLYFELADLDFDPTDFYYLKSDLIDLTAFNLNRSLLNFSLKDNTLYIHLTPTHLSFHSLVPYPLEKPSFQICCYRGDTIVKTNFIFIELEIRKNNVRVF